MNAAKDLPPTQVLTPPCRLAFPHLFEPKPKMNARDGKLFFQASVLIPPDVSLDPFASAIKAAMMDKWGKIEKLADDKFPIKKCDGRKYAGYEDGWHFVRANSQFAPIVVDQQRKHVLDRNNTIPEALNDAIARAKAVVYPGVWCRFLLDAYCWTNSGNRGVSFGILAVQLVRNDERLDSRADVDDIFDPIQVDTTKPPSGGLSDLLG